MKSHKNLFGRSTIHALVIAIGLGIGLPTVSADFLLMNPPPDVDKEFLPNNGSCWLATASNMLAGAGYGHGDTVQDRAEGIYAELILEFGTAQGGWPKMAIDWWLANCNDLPSNPYDYCEEYREPFDPIMGENMPRNIGNWLRGRYFVGLTIETMMSVSGDPIDGIGIDDPNDGVRPNGYIPPPVKNFELVNHAITAWGDEMDDAELADNPEQVQVTDSDRDDDEEYDQDGNIDVQQYEWSQDVTTGRWRLNYSTFPSTLLGVTVLRSLDEVLDAQDTQLVVGSYRIHQDNDDYAATDLHYTVGTDTDICSYRTVIDWPRPNDPNYPEIAEDQDPPRSLQVEWNLSQDPVPYCEWVTITTEFVLSRWNSIRYTDVHWTYPVTMIRIQPGFNWRVLTPQHIDPNALPANATGGYVIGCFDIIEMIAEGGAIYSPRLVGQYRFQHEYLYFQDPERHDFELMPEQVPSWERAYFITNLRFGHSYGRLQDESLWMFNRWMTEYPNVYPFTPDEPIQLQIDWKGRLPYPQAVGPLPACMENIPGDLNQDCIVDLKDFAIMTDYWLADVNSVFHWKTP